MEKRLTLKQMFLNKIDDSPRGYAEELAKISGSYSSGSNLKKVLKSEDKEFDSFNGLVKMVQYVFDKDELALMEQYSMEIDPCNKTARIMLEYLGNNRLLNSMEKLINKMIDGKNKESREWGKVYTIKLNWHQNYHTLNANEYLDSIRECKTTIPELKIFLKILRCHGLYFKKAHAMAFELSNELIIEIEEIKEDYLKDVYSTLLNEIQSYIYIRVLNNPDEAKNKAMLVLNSNIGNTHKAYAHYTIGCSYFYESYDKAKENFLQSIEIYQSINRENAVLDVKEISELLDIIWDKKIQNVRYSEEYKMYWILKNKMNFKFEINKEKIDAPYYYLLKGMKEDNNDMLVQSMIHFVKRGDIFFANLPKIELLNRGYSSVIINEWMNFYV